MYNSNVYTHSVKILYFLFNFQKCVYQSCSRSSKGDRSHLFVMTLKVSGINLRSSCSSTSWAGQNTQPSTYMFFRSANLLRSKFRQRVIFGRPLRSSNSEPGCCIYQSHWHTTSGCAASGQIQAKNIRMMRPYTRTVAFLSSINDAMQQESSVRRALLLEFDGCTSWLLAVRKRR